MTAHFEFDVFLSHSSKDKAIVRALAERLKRDGLRVWFDDWEIRLGDSIPRMVERGLEHSNYLIFFMSANAFGSDWATLETQTFRFNDQLNRSRRFIPIRLDHAPIKGALKTFKYLDWQTQSEDGYQQLLAACQGGAPAAEPQPIPGLLPLDLDEFSKHWPHQRDVLALAFVKQAGSHLPIMFAHVQDEYCLRVHSKKPGYVLLFAQGASKTLFQLIPNTVVGVPKLDVGTRFWPGELLPLPAQELGAFDHIYFGSAGIERVIGFWLEQLPPMVRPRKLGGQFNVAELQEILAWLYGDSHASMAFCILAVTDTAWAARPVG